MKRMLIPRVGCLFLVLAGSLAPAWAQQIKIACIGDSNTRGYGVASPGLTAYPAVLGKLLGTNYLVRNFGVDGTTMLRKGSSPNAPYWNTAEFANAKSFQPDIVTIMLGTNDSTTNNWRFKDEFAADCSDLIDVFRNLPSHPIVFLCAPVPAYGVQWDITPDVVRAEVVPILKRVARDKGVVFVNTHTPLTGRVDLYISDLIHPNEAGEAIMAKAIHAAILGPP